MADLATASSEPSLLVGPAHLDEERWESLDERRQARERRVARDLIELSRLTRGGEQAEAIPVDLARLIHTICRDYPALTPEGPATLRLSTDSRRLSRVLFALLDNAYLHGAPPVRVRYDAHEVVIADSGPGFAESVLAHAMEPFVTGRPSRGRGVGLGLAIAAGHAAVLGAELRVVNAAERGALATLRFAPGDPARLC